MPPAALRHGERVVVQSLAICEYLEEALDAPPLLPADPPGRARVRSIVQTICSEVQPLNNLSVMQYLKNDTGLDDDAYGAWYLPTGHVAYTSLAGGLYVAPFDAESLTITGGSVPAIPGDRTRFQRTALGSKTGSRLRPVIVFH